MKIGGSGWLRRVGIGRGEGPLFLERTGVLKKWGCVEVPLLILIPGTEY